MPKKKKKDQGILKGLDPKYFENRGDKGNINATALIKCPVF